MPFGGFYIPKNLHKAYLKGAPGSFCFFKILGNILLQCLIMLSNEKINIMSYRTLNIIMMDSKSPFFLKYIIVIHLTSPSLLKSDAEGLTVRSPYHALRPRRPRHVTWRRLARRRWSGSVPTSNRKKNTQNRGKPGKTRCFMSFPSQKIFVLFLLEFLFFP